MRPSRSVSPALWSFEFCQICVNNVKYDVNIVYNNWKCYTFSKVIKRDAHEKKDEKEIKIQGRISMENELEVIESTYELARGVGGALVSFLSMYKKNNIINKAQEEILKEKIRRYKAIQKSNDITAVGNNNIIQIMKTVKMIDEMNLQEPALGMVMKQLTILSEALNEILEDFKRGY